MNSSFGISEIITAALTSYLSVFGSNAGKYGLEITPYLDTFHAVYRKLVAISFWASLVKIIMYKISMMI